MDRLRYAWALLTLLAVGALFGGSLYDTLVMSPNFHGGPNGLEHGRLFMSFATPANLFRVLAPACQVLTFLMLLLVWRSSYLRWRVLFALVALLLADVITFTYHYPRNHILFTAPLTVPADQLEHVATEWQKANFVRVLLVLAAWFGTVKAFERLSVQRFRLSTS